MPDNVGIKATLPMNNLLSSSTSMAIKNTHLSSLTFQSKHNEEAKKVLFDLAQPGIINKIMDSINNNTELNDPKLEKLKDKLVNPISRKAIYKEVLLFLDESPDYQKIKKINNFATKFKKQNKINSNSALHPKKNKEISFGFDPITIASIFAVGKGIEIVGSLVNDHNVNKVNTFENLTTGELNKINSSNINNAIIQTLHPLIDYRETDELFVFNSAFLLALTNTEPKETTKIIDLIDCVKFLPGKLENNERDKELSLGKVSPFSTELITEKDIFKKIKISNTTPLINQILNTNYFKDREDFIKRFKNYKSFQNLIGTNKLDEDNKHNTWTLINNAKKREEELRNNFINFIINTNSYVRKNNEVNLNFVQKAWDSIALGLQNNMMRTKEFAPKVKEQLRIIKEETEYKEGWGGLNPFSEADEKIQKANQEIGKLAINYWLKYCLPKVMDNEFEKMILIKNNEKDPSVNRYIRTCLNMDINNNLKIYALRHQNNNNFISALASQSSTEDKEKIIKGAYMMEGSLLIDALNKIDDSNYENELDLYQKSMLHYQMSGRFKNAQEHIEKKEKAYGWADIGNFIGNIGEKVSSMALMAEITSCVGGIFGDNSDITDLTPSPDDFDSSLNGYDFDGDGIADFDINGDGIIDSNDFSSTHFDIYNSMNSDILTSKPEIGFTGGNLTPSDTNHLNNFSDWFNHSDIHKLLENKDVTDYLNAHPGLKNLVEHSVKDYGHNLGYNLGTTVFSKVVETSKKCIVEGKTFNRDEFFRELVKEAKKVPIQAIFSTALEESINYNTIMHESSFKDHLAFDDKYKNTAFDPFVRMDERVINAIKNEDKMNDAQKIVITTLVGQLSTAVLSHICPANSNVEILEKAKREINQAPIMLQAVIDKGGSKYDQQKYNELIENLQIAYKDKKIEQIRTIQEDITKLIEKVMLS